MTGAADPWQAIFTVEEIAHLADMFAGANDPTSAAIGEKAQHILESIGAREQLVPPGTPTTISKLAILMATSDPTAQPLQFERAGQRIDPPR